MSAIDGEKITKHCSFTQKLINDCKHSVIIDYSDSLLKVKKEKDLSLMFN